jgi:hypothetical protein
MQCETIQIKAEDDSCLTINKSDYNSDAHTLYVAPEPEIEPEIEKPAVKRAK